MEAGKRKEPASGGEPSRGSPEPSKYTRYKVMAKRARRVPNRLPTPPEQTIPDAPAPAPPQSATQIPVPPVPAARSYRYPICIWCGMMHPAVQCLKGTDRCYQCGRAGHRMRDCPGFPPQAPATGSSYRQEELRYEASRRAAREAGLYPLCRNCGFRHEAVPCLKGTGRCYGCGEYGHYLRDCPRNDRSGV